MADDETLRKLDDSELAEWHMLQAQVSSLTLQLANMTAQRDDAVSALQNSGAEMDARLNAWQHEIRRYVEARDNARADATRATNRFVLLASIAQDAFADFLETYSPFPDEALTPEWRTRRKNVREMMALIERECT